MSARMDFDNETLSIEEAAKLARCGVDCMRKLIQAGQVPAASFNSKHMVLLREDVLELVRSTARRQQTARAKVRPVELPSRNTRRRTPDLSGYELPQLRGEH